MNIKCPHCGTEYEVEKKDMYRYTKCSVCGNGFVIGGDTVGKPLQSPPKNEKFAPRRLQSANVTIPSRFAQPKKGAHATTSTASEKPRTRMTKRKKVVTAICVALGVFIVVGVATFGGYLYFGDQPRLNRGIACYEKGLYPKAYKLLLPLAKQGYAKAQLLVGDCHANGYGVFMDTDEAVKWYRLAADQELPEAQHRMFVCCRDGIGLERNLANAAKWCRKAADDGLEDAIYDMGMLYVEGAGVERNAKSAFKWFRKGAERGHPMCLYKFGQCYKLGFGVEKDEDEASKWQNKAVAAWRTSANSGDTGAMVRLAELYMKGDVVELDKEEAVKWYRKGAELGNETAQYELATCYHNGNGVEEDQEESARWMLKAAEKGSDRGVQWAMGRYYQEGWGVEKNQVEAVKWFERSAKKGFSLAKYYLAMCYMNGEGVAKDEAKGEELLKDAADAGCKAANDEVARIEKEREEQARKLAEEKAKKKMQIDRLVDIEDVVEERLSRINEILDGKLSGEWAGFDASKISSTDSSVSVKAEPTAIRLSEKLSDADSLDAIEKAIKNASSEVDRLQARLDAINGVKKVYDAKELASRKETCTPCGGVGTMECERCKGKGEILVKGKAPCPTCVGGGDDGDDDGDDFSGGGFASRGSGRRGQVKKQVTCGNCHGTGQIRRKCGTCNGKKKVAIEEPGRMRRYERCSECNGSGYGYPEACPRCDGNKKLEVWQTCATCQGRGEVTNGSKVTCPTCNGKCKLKCDRCGGRGFTYRPKEGVASQQIKRD